MGNADVTELSTESASVMHIKSAHKRDVNLGAAKTYECHAWRINNCHLQSCKHALFSVFGTALDRAGRSLPAKLPPPWIGDCDWQRLQEPAMGLFAATPCNSAT